MRRPSGLKTALITSASWPVRTVSCAPVAASHTRAVPSDDAVTIREPSAL